MRRRGAESREEGVPGWCGVHKFNRRGGWADSCFCESKDVGIVDVCEIIEGSGVLRIYHRAGAEGKDYNMRGGAVEGGGTRV